MKSKIILFITLMFVGILSLQAQPGQRRTVEERVKQATDRAKDSLKLSEAQLTDVSAALTQFYMASDKLREGLAPGQRPEKTAMDQLLEIRDGKLKLVLSEAQFTKYKEMDAAMRNRNRQRPPGQ